MPYFQWNKKFWHTRIELHPGRKILSSPTIGVNHWTNLKEISESNCSNRSIKAGLCGTLPLEYKKFCQYLCIITLVTTISTRMAWNKPANARNLANPKVSRFHKEFFPFSSKKLPAPFSIRMKSSPPFFRKKSDCSLFSRKKVTTCLFFLNKNFTPPCR